MDAVYILGTGSPCANEEIRYSIRALEENMLDLRNVWIIGELPKFLPVIFHVAANDLMSEKWKNAYVKTRIACEQGEISDDFILMNDDFFMCEPFMGAELPFFALQGSNGGTCGQHSFQVHAPMRINKEMYAKMPFSLEQKACRSPRSFYANFYKAPPKFVTDCILRTGAGGKTPREAARGRAYFSIGDPTILFGPFRDWLAERWPTPSKYEA